jgi:hypothetical protein
VPDRPTLKGKRDCVILALLGWLRPSPAVAGLSICIERPVWLGRVLSAQAAFTRSTARRSPMALRMAARLLSPGFPS